MHIAKRKMKCKWQQKALCRHIASHHFVRPPLFGSFGLHMREHSSQTIHKFTDTVTPSAVFRFFFFSLFAPPSLSLSLLSFRFSLRFAAERVPKRLRTCECGSGGDSDDEDDSVDNDNKSNTGKRCRCRRRRHRLPRP